MKNVPAKTVFPWLRANLGKRALAPLTGTDARALAAAVQIIEHYSYDPDPRVLAAFALMVQRMQPKCQIFAYHAIAHPMDWASRAIIWQSVGLPPITEPSLCAFEPGAAARTAPCPEC